MKTKKRCKWANKQCSISWKPNYKKTAFKLLAIATVIQSKKPLSVTKCHILTNFKNFLSSSWGTYLPRRSQNMLKVWGSSNKTRQINFVAIYCIQGCRSLLSIGGHKLLFYPNFALFFSGGMNFDHDCFHISKVSKDQKKKGLHQKWNTFFPRIQDQ